MNNRTVTVVYHDTGFLHKIFRLEKDADNYCKKNKHYTWESWGVISKKKVKTVKKDEN